MSKMTCQSCNGTGQVLDYVLPLESRASHRRECTACAGWGTVYSGEQNPRPDIEQFIAAVLMAVTDGETDNIAKFPTNTRELLETLYGEMRA